MSLADHEIEPVDEWEDFCSTHAQYYSVWLVCGGCLEDAFDRALQDRLDERETQP